MDVCYPEGTEWSCAFDAETLAEMRADPDKGPLLERSEALAWSSLASLLAFRLSLCPSLIRPCLKKCGGRTWDVSPVGGFGDFSPYISNGKWYNGCGCVTDCSCTSLCEVVMPAEVGGIAEVKVDGAVLDPTAYRVDNGNRLVRTDGGCWPSCQNMALDDTEAGTFSVSYYPGLAPNDLLRYAAGLLAAEFYLACSGKECRLPTGVTQISRAGVSMEVQTGLFAGGSTGITEVDAIIRIYNPSALKGPSRVLSPDRGTARTSTWRS